MWPASKTSESSGQASEPWLVLIAVGPCGVLPISSLPHTHTTQSGAALTPGWMIHDCA